MAGRHQERDGTVHVDEPTRQLDIAPDPAAAGRRPLHVPPALVDARLLVVAALVASPAAYRWAQGLVSVSEAMTRYLLVALGCVVVSVVVRLLWPVLAGEDLSPRAIPTGSPEGTAAPGFAVLEEGAEPLDALGSLDPIGSSGTFDEGDVDGLAGFSAFDDLDSLELSSG